MNIAGGRKNQKKRAAKEEWLASIAGPVSRICPLTQLAAFQCPLFHRMTSLKTRSKTR